MVSEKTESVLVHHEKSQVRKALVEPLGLIRDNPSSLFKVVHAGHSLASCHQYSVLQGKMIAPDMNSIDYMHVYDVLRISLVMSLYWELALPLRALQAALDAPWLWGLESFRASADDLVT